MKKRYKISLFAVIPVVVLTIFILTAAGGQEAAGEPEGNRLVVYTYDSFPAGLEEHIKATLEEEGVTVEMLRFEDSGGVMAQILLEKDNPQADVVIGLDNTYLARAFEEELFQAYKPSGLRLAHERLLVDPEHRLIPFDYGSITFNYDSELLPDPPESWEELLDPAYQDKIIVMNPTTASPGRNFLLFTIAEFGEDGYLDFWEELKPNILTVTGGWSEGYGLYTQGEAPIVLSYDTSPAYHLHFEETDRYKNLIFNGRAYAQVEVAGILMGAENLAAAKRCMDVIVSKDFQDLVPLNNIMYPVHPDAELPDAFIEAESASEIVNMDERVVAEKLDEWLAAWEELMRRP